MNQIQKKIINIYNKYPEIPFNIRGGFDRYGFSYYLANKYNKFCFRSFGNWLHGWIWWAATTPEELMFESNIKIKPHVVSNKQQHQMLIENGFQNVFIGGLPFSYTTSNIFEKEPDSLLAMPPHSSEIDKLSKAQNDFFDYLNSIKNNFSCVFVSLHKLDVNDNITKTLKKMNINWLLGSSPSDLNSLPRMRAIFDNFDHVVSNSMGSHIAYALSSGCNVSLSGPLYKWDENDFNHAGNKWLISKIIQELDCNKIKIDYPYLLADNPRNGFRSIDLGNLFIGSDNILSDRQLFDALSWSPVLQVKGYYDSFKFRFQHTNLSTRNNP